jgi:hypothetical protein
LYTLIKDPETGRRLYADIGVDILPKRLACGELVHTLKKMDVRDVVTEDKLVGDVVRGLRGVVVKDSNLLNTILLDAFSISVDTCPELVMAVQDRLKGAEIEEAML